MSAALKGRKPSAATLAGFIAFRTGRPHSEETKAKMSTAHKGRAKPPVSAETRARMADAQRGKKRVFSDEHRAKLSAAATGRRLSAETRAKIRLQWQKKREV